MTAAILPEEIVTGLGGDVDHWYCCDPDVAYCGLDLSGVPDGEEFDEMCPLCVLADEAGGFCPSCSPAVAS